MATCEQSSGSAKNVEQKLCAWRASAKFVFCFIKEIPMKVLFKILKWFVIVALLLIVLVIGGLYGFLKHGLTRTVQQHVLPVVLEQTGLDAELDFVSLDLFKGVFDISGIRVKNPAGFAEPNLLELESAAVSVQLKSLLALDPLVVQRIKLQGAKLHVVRNREKVINLHQIQQELKLPAAQVPEGRPAEAAPAEVVPAEPLGSMPLLALVLRALEADVTVDYVDHSEEPIVETGELTLNLRGRNLATATAGDVPWGELYLMAKVMVNDHSFPINFNMLLAPYDSPETLSFDLKGVPFEVDGSLINKAIDKLGVASKKVWLEVDVKARKGVFVVPDSVIGTELKGATLDKSVAGVELTASSLKFELPVSGSVMKPVIDWKSSLNSVIKQNQKVLLKEMGGQLINKAVREKDKAGIQSLGAALGLNLGLTETPAEPAKEAEPEKTATEPEKEQSTEEKVLGGVLRVLEQHDKEDGEPEAQAVEEVLKLFSR
jgi:hypothetical protein